VASNLSSDAGFLEDQPQKKVARPGGQDGRFGAQRSGADKPLAQESSALRLRTLTLQIARDRKKELAASQGDKPFLGIGIENG